MPHQIRTIVDAEGVILEYGHDTHKRMNERRCISDGYRVMRQKYAPYVAFCELDQDGSLETRLPLFSPEVSIASNKA